MKLLIKTTTLGAALAGGLALAAPAAKPPADAHAAHQSGGGHGMMMGMGGGEGMMGMCPGMLGAGSKFQVAKLANGVTITITSDDAKEVAKIQKMAEGMRLMHEARQ